MDKFYPKNFVLWRPQLLLLLIFLEVVFHCAGGRGPGIHAARLVGWGGHKDYCKVDASCRPDFVCDPLRKMCVCRNTHTDKLFLFYDEDLDKCTSAVGRACNMEVAKTDGLPTFDCVRHAECVRPAGIKLAEQWGICQCQPGWEATEELLCRRPVVIRVGDGDPIFTSLAQKRVGVGMEGGLPHEDVPIEEDMMSTEENNEILIVGEGDPKKDDSKIPIKALISPTAENPNKGIHPDKAGLANLKDVDFFTSNPNAYYNLNGGSSNTKSVVALIVTLHAFVFLFTV